MIEPEERKDSVQDLGGNWWYQDPDTASWYIWNGQEWKLIPGAVPRIAPPQKDAKPKKRALLNWPWLLALFAGGLIGIVVVAGVSLVAFNFFPDYYINPGDGNLEQILKLGGLGLAVTVLGLMMLKNGFFNLLPEQTVDDDDWLKPKVKRGCGTIVNGVGQSFFGLIFLTGGLILMTVVFYQDVLPWLGF